METASGVINGSAIRAIREPDQQRISELRDKVLDLELRVAYLVNEREQSEKLNQQIREQSVQNGIMTGRIECCLVLREWGYGSAANHLEEHFGNAI